MRDDFGWKTVAAIVKLVFFGNAPGVSSNSAHFR